MFFNRGQGDFLVSWGAFRDYLIIIDFLWDFSHIASWATWNAANIAFDELYFTTIVGLFSNLDLHWDTIEKTILKILEILIFAKNNYI